jgi:4-hydroxyacetophenone monooxygenase
MTAKEQTSARAMAERADPFLLIASLASRGVDGGLLDAAMPYAMRGMMRVAEDLPADLRAKAAERVLADLAAGPAPALPQTDPRWRKIIDFAAGVKVPDEYVDMLTEESGLWTRRLYEDKPVAARVKPPHVAIIGGGLSGIAVAIYLKKAGIPFVIYEKNSGPGGTWYDNRYPGCGVDTTTHLYSYSFALNPSWTRYFSKQGELMDYIESCIDRFELRPHISFDTTIEGADYDAATGRWRLSMTVGGKPERREADVVVSAVGQLNVPSMPRIKGLDSFAGPVVHTARWRPDIDVAGKRVAIVGSGASAVQVGPSIAPSVSRLLAFQRSPQWLSSRPLYHQPVRPEDRWGYENVPLYLNWYRLTLYWTFGDRLYNVLMLEDGPQGRRLSAQSDELRRMFTTYIHERLAGRPDLIEKVVPDYPPMAKRIPIDFGWFDMLKRDNVELVTEAIDHVEKDAIVTADGRRHDVDLIVLATGFEATRMLQHVPIHGRDGAELQTVWSGDDPRAYLGMMVPGFPNFFIMYGPNTNLGHGGSLIFQIECQARYIAAAVSHLTSNGAKTLEVRRDVYDAYNEKLDRLLERTVWNSPGVNSWFKNSRGRVATNSPWRLVDYWRLTRSFAPSDCQLTGTDPA